MANVKTSDSGRRYIDIDEVIANRLQQIHAQINTKVRDAIAECLTLAEIEALSGHSLANLVAALSTAESNLAQEVLANVSQVPFPASANAVANRLRELFIRLNVKID